MNEPTATSEIIFRRYDGKPFAERLVDAEGIVWERRLLINGPGRWYVVGSI